jgi:4-amino-4-deoxy-L-arabinose transferase-like glycosyltransferase
MFAPRAALLGAALLAVSAVVVFDAHQARADQVLLGLTTLAMALLWSVVRRAQRGERVGIARWLALWAVVGLGVLVKGVSPVVVFATIIALGVVGRTWIAWRAARPLLGIIVIAAVVAPWAFALAQRVGLETYLDILFDETVKRGSQAKEGHVGPPGYHLAFVWAMFWPGSIAVLAGAWWGARRAMRLGPRGSRWSGRIVGDRRVLFLACWIVPTWIFFEIYATKLPHYVLPTYPALALLTARAALGMRIGPRLRRTGAVLFGLVGLLVPMAAVGFAIGFELVQPAVWLIVRAALVMLLLAGFATWRAWSGQLRSAVTPAVFAMIPLAVIVHAAVIPRLTTFSPELVERIDELGIADRPLGAMGYHEDSLIFLSRGRIERIVHTDSVAWLANHPDGVLLARRLYRDEVGLDDSFTTIESLTGFQFASSDIVTVDFVENPSEEAGE